VTRVMGPGLLFVVSGPSGAGKDTIVDGLRHRMPRLRYSVSSTTRPPRAGEREGEAYFFLDRDLFEQKAAAGEFLETREYNGHLYGTPRSFIEQTLDDGYDVIMKPEVNGALAIKHSFPKAVLIFLLPDKFSHLKLRLANRRTESNEQIASRLAIAHEELGSIRKFDYVVINEQTDVADESLPAIGDLEAIVHAERHRILHYDDQTIRNVATS
jgi:guanylate kinase